MMLLFYVHVAVSAHADLASSPGFLSEEYLFEHAKKEALAAGKAVTRKNFDGSSDPIDDGGTLIRRRLREHLD
mgnify:CR=1 FL=1